MILQLSRRHMLMLAALPLLGSCGRGAGWKPYSYRLTIEVETPEGLRTGSGVVSLRADEGWPSGRLRIQQRGEGAMVDLGARGRLFSLLTKAGGDHWLPRLTPDTPDAERKRAASGGSNEPQADAMYDDQVVQPRLKKPLNEWVDAYPRLVRIETINGKQVPRLVDPDKLDAAFGDKVRLRRIIAQVVEEPAEITIDKYLPYMSPARGSVPGSVLYGTKEYQEGWMGNSDFYRREWL